MNLFAICASVFTKSGGVCSGIANSISKVRKVKLDAIVNVMAALCFRVNLGKTKALCKYSEVANKFKRVTSETLNPFVICYFLQNLEIRNIVNRIRTIYGDQ